MFTCNFAVAVVTVILRGLVDRILTSMQTPIIKPPIVSSSAGSVLVSGLLYLLYIRLVKGKKFSTESRKFPSGDRQRNLQILDGRVEKTSSQTSSGNWSLRRFRSCRSTSRDRNNLLQATRDSLEMVRDCSSTCSVCSKSASSSKKEDTPSIYSFKSANVSEKLDKSDDPSTEACTSGFGDWEHCRPNICKGRKRKPRTRQDKTTARKTRSGKIYSTYL